MFYIRLLILVVVAGWSASFACEFFQAKRWGWFVISTVVALLCAWSFIGLFANLL
jgi:hypothetical protein